jgi:hypothetical protein
MRSRPSFIVSTGELPERSHVYPQSEEEMGPVRSAGSAAGLVRLGINLQRACPPASDHHGLMLNRMRKSSFTSSKAKSTPGSMGNFISCARVTWRHFPPERVSVTVSSTTLKLRRCSWLGAKPRNAAIALPIHRTHHAVQTSRQLIGGTTRRREDLGAMTGFRINCAPPSDRVVPPSVSFKRTCLRYTTWATPKIRGRGSVFGGGSPGLRPKEAAAEQSWRLSRDRASGLIASDR